MAAKPGYGALPFNEQIRFMRRKLNMTTEGWTDVYAAEHDWSFIVAGANRDEIVADFYVAVEKVMVDGGTLEQFRADFDSIVAKHGWDYNGGRNWRSRVIYETNLFSSYQAGRYEQLMLLRETMPFWEYQHSDSVAHPRELHVFWHGLILRWDDPWWQVYFPINAYGCQCYVIARSWDDLTRLGKSGPDTAPLIEYEDRVIGKNSPGGPQVVRVPRGVDPGFEYAPGRSRLNSQVSPPSVDELFADLQSDDQDVQRIMTKGLAETDYIQQFLSEFGASFDKPVIYFDVTRRPLVISAEMFIDPSSSEFVSQGKEYLLLLADVIKSPAEIWQYIEHDPVSKKAVIRRRYVSQFTVAGVQRVAVFDIGKDGWTTQTLALVTPDNLAQIQRGQRIYQRDDLT